MIGNSHLLISDRAVEIAAEKVRRDPELRRAIASAEDVAHIRDGRDLSIDYFAAAFERYSDRPCLGTRDVGPPAGPQAQVSFAPRFTTISYGALWQRVTALATGCAVSELLMPGELVGICGVPSVDWVVADLVCLYRGAVSVPLRSNGAELELRHIIGLCRITTLICGAAQLPALAKLLRDGTAITRVIVMAGAPAEPSRSRMVADAVAELRRHLSVTQMAELEARGRTAPVVAPERPADAETLVTIVFSSGSTGNAKGVMLPERRWGNHLRAALARPRIPFVVVANLPHSHIAGRRLVLETMMLGGVSYFTARPDMSRVFEDMRLVRPTVVGLLPRLATAIYREFLRELSRRGEPTDDPVRAANSDAGRQVMADMAQVFLGDRVCLIRCGTAALDAEVQRVLERCFDVPVTNEYGSTETGSISVGGMLYPHVEYKLVDVPELGYSTDDSPYPRGELRIRSPDLTPGYFGDPAASAAMVDEDGYGRFGDIVEQRGPGHLVVIDRRESVVRLAHGEFVGVSRLESVYAGAGPLIQQIYLHASPHRAHLLGVIVPDAEPAQTMPATADGEAAIRRAVRLELDRIARRERLKGHEIPREFLIVREPFSMDNGLLTGSGKLNRPRLRQRYTAELEALYAEIETRSSASHDVVPADVADSAEDAVIGLTAVALGLRAEAIDADRDKLGFVGLGGDSFTASRLASLIHDALGVSVPIASLLDPVGTIAGLVRQVEALREARADSIGYLELHGAAPELRASDLDLGRFVAPEPHGGAAPGGRNVVLLTGANGFLGRFVLLELLERLPARGGKVVCLVRGASSQLARDRIVDAFARSGSDLLGRFESLAAGGRLVVQPADLSQPGLGVDDATYRELADTVDVIVHNGALVNHALSYRQLFESNVLGTVEIARLAARGRRKPVTFVSTLGVAAMPGRHETVLERDTAAALWPIRSAGEPPSAPAVGYVSTKWAGEILLEQLHERHGIPVSVFRCGMVLPHPSHAAQVNQVDSINRLLAALRDTGVAPSSFYTGDGRARYDGIPVDVVSASIAASAVAGDDGYRIYHVSNAQTEPAASLDSFVDWMQSAGIALTRLPHPVWYAELLRRLEARAGGSRAASSLWWTARWQHPIDTGALAPIDTSAYRARLARLLGREVPAVDEAFIHHWMRSL